MKNGHELPMLLDRRLGDFLFFNLWLCRPIPHSCDRHFASTVGHPGPDLLQQLQSWDLGVSAAFGLPDDLSLVPYIATPFLTQNPSWLCFLP